MEFPSTWAEEATKIGMVEIETARRIAKEQVEKEEKENQAKQALLATE